jgi:hypothetical protein
MGQLDPDGILQLEGEAIEDDGLSLEVSDVELEAAAGETTHPSQRARPRGSKQSAGASSPLSPARSQRNHLGSEPARSPLHDDPAATAAVNALLESGAARS